MLVISLMVMLWTVPLLRYRVRCVVLVLLVTSLWICQALPILL